MSGFSVVFILLSLIIAVLSLWDGFANKNPYNKALGIGMFGFIALIFISMALGIYDDSEPTARSIDSTPRTQLRCPDQPGV